MFILFFYFIHSLFIELFIFNSLRYMLTLQREILVLLLYLNFLHLFLSIFLYNCHVLKRFYKQEILIKKYLELFATHTMKEFDFLIEQAFFFQEVVQDYKKQPLDVYSIFCNQESDHLKKWFLKNAPLNFLTDDIGRNYFIFNSDIEKKLLESDLFEDIDMETFKKEIDPLKYHAIFYSFKDAHTFLNYKNLIIELADKTIEMESEELRNDIDYYFCYIILDLLLIPYFFYLTYKTL